MHAERGRLLFRVAAENRQERFIWTIVAIALAIFYAYEAYKEHRSDWGMVIFFVGYGLSFLLSRKVGFYEKGIHFPEEPSGGRTRFIAWPQIKRFYWDQDVLTIVPESSILSGGSGGAPIIGGSVRIPTGRRVQVENLLSVVPDGRV
jgi:hypothetical protein